MSKGIITVVGGGSRRINCMSARIRLYVPMSRSMHMALSSNALIKAKFWAGLLQVTSCRNFSSTNDREQVLEQLRHAATKTRSMEEKKEEEMFSDLPGSLSDCDTHWRLNKAEYIGSSVSDHDNWVRDRLESWHKLIFQSRIRCIDDDHLHLFSKELRGFRVI
jgi:hypothetical protein